MDEPLLRPQVVTAPPSRRRRRPERPVCPKCWQPVVPLSGHDDLTGAFGHRGDCPDRGIDPSTGDLEGRWLYGEPGWDCPVILCEECGQAALAAVGDDENYVVMPAASVEDWEWVQWLYENPADRCWDCETRLPT